MGYLSTSSFRYPIVLLLIICMYLTNVYASGRIFNVRMKPKVVSKFSRKAEEIHSPAPVDFHLGGNSSIWSYFTELSIGTPPQLFTVLIDTGSTITWLNCQNCIGCLPDDNEEGPHLKPYNPEASTTSEIVKEGKPFCKSQADPSSPCTYNMSYYDGTVTRGYFVRDILNYNRVTGDHQTQTGATKFTFGCTTEQTSNTSAGLVDVGIDGLLGLGYGSATLLGQMSKSGSTRNVFSMCIDRRRGGGIFAVGKVVNPKVEMLPNIDTYGGYSLAVQSMSFGDDAIKLNGTPSALLDTGSDVAFIPEAVQVAVANLIWKKLLVTPIPYLGYHCFWFPEKVLSEAYFDTVLPTWTFKFSDTVSISVSPRNYMWYDHSNDRWCIASNKHEYNMLILGLPVLSEKLIVYDNENKTVGLTDYDCASSVEVEDDGTGKAVEVDSHIAVSHV